MGKGENAGYQHFLPFPTIFSKGLFPVSLDSWLCGQGRKEYLMSHLFCTAFNAVFQHNFLYHGGQCTYPCLPEIYCSLYTEGRQTENASDDQQGFFSHPKRVNLLPDMPVLGFSNSAANKNIILRIWKMGNTIIGLSRKNILGKGEIDLFVHSDLDLLCPQPDIILVWFHNHKIGHRY